MLDAVRFPTLGYWEKATTGLGSIYLKKNDPEANFSDDCFPYYMDYFVLNNEFSKLNADYWTAFLKLCFNCAKNYKTELEVSCNLYLQDGSFILAVPEQKVSTAHVHTIKKGKLVDLLTGKEVDPFYIDYCGAFHSHNTMTMSTFSPTDDEYELPLDGFYTLISNINLAKNTYKVTGSVVIDKERRYLDYKAYIDTANSKATFHKNALKQISIYTLPPLPPIQRIHRQTPHTSTISSLYKNNYECEIAEFINDSNMNIDKLRKLSDLSDLHGLDLSTYLDLIKGDILL
jgi:hypothetical protein